MAEFNCLCSTTKQTSRNHLNIVSQCSKYILSCYLLHQIHVAFHPQRLSFFYNELDLPDILVELHFSELRGKLMGVCRDSQFSRPEFGYLVFMT